MVRLPTLLLIVAAVAPSVGAASGRGNAYAELQPGVVVADLTGDGHPDIANGRGKTLKVQPGNGDATFGAAIASSIGGSAFDLGAGDLNGDAAPDLVALAPGSVVPLLNAGRGAFTKTPTVAVGKTASSVVLADFTGDGKLDVALGDSKRRGVDVLPGNGDGSFGPAISTATPAAPATLQVGDFNGDGRPDLATRDTVLRGAGDGHFAAQPNPLLPGQGQAVGDVNGDGRSDLVGVNTVDVDVTVALADATGGFTAPSAYATGRGPMAVTLGDFTGDGRIDIMTADFLGNRYSVLPGNGDGSFGTPIEYGRQQERMPTMFIAADFDGDGRSDLLMGASGEAKNVATAAKSQPSLPPGRPEAKRAARKKQFAKGGCRPPRESETIKKTRGARMYNSASGLYACLVSRGRLVRLIAERADDFYVKQVRFAGPYVAYAWEGVGAVEGGWYEIALYDLRRGIRIYGPIDPLSVSTDTIGRAYNFSGEGIVRDLELRPNGSMAWTVDATGAASTQSVLLMREVWRLDSHGRTMLDHGQKIAPTSLTLTGSRVTWRKGGRVVSAQLR